MEKEKIKDRIKEEKLDKYLEKTKKALEIAKNKINKKKEAKEIIKMVEDYLNDAQYFKKKKDYLNAFAAINYSHGWLDSGARLGIFDVKDDSLFTIK